MTKSELRMVKNALKYLLATGEWQGMVVYRGISLSTYEKFLQRL
jgi:hypothetical protein